MSLEAEHRPSPKSNTERPKTSAASLLPKPTSCRHNSIRRSTCSRGSSFLIRQPSETHPRRPRMPLRASSAVHACTYSAKSSIAYTDYTPLFRSLEASLASEAEPSAVGPQAHLISTSLPTLVTSTTMAELSSDQSSPTLTDYPKFKHQPSYSNHIPATTIDWTLPSTRRRQYDEIDKSCHGIRGLVRRFTPRLFISNGDAVGFYDAGNSSDAGTVRRYRMDDEDYDSDVDEIEDEKNCFGKGIGEIGRTGGSAGRQPRKKWSCFTFGRREAREKA